MFRKPGEPRIDSRRDPGTGSAGRIHEATEQRAEPDGFVVFSDDWGGHPSSCQHIFSRIAAEHRVVWINTVGMRRPRLTRSDLAKAFGKVGRMWHTASAAPRDERLSNLSACQPLMLPFSDVALIRKWNARSVARSLRVNLAARGIERPVVVATVPNACDALAELDESPVVYYCVDDLAQWPGLERSLIQEMEAQLVARADLLIATSQKLLERLSASGKPTYLLPHGVDVELFSAIAAAEHECLAGIPPPRAGCFGLFDERNDQDLIEDVARRLPQVAFVFTGRVEASCSRLTRLSNVHFTGPVAYRDLPAVIKGLDLLFLAYGRNELTESISPLKLREYLVTGKPVVSTPLPETKPFAEWISLAATAEQWEAAIRLALEGRGQRRQAWVPSGESWADRAEMMLRICAQARTSATRSSSIDLAPLLGSREG